jgi:hypothetical protein
MRKLAVLAVLSLLLIAPTTARARLLRTTPLEVALARAFQLWGMKPCDGRYTVQLSVGPLLADGVAKPTEALELVPTVEGAASLDTPLGENTFGTPPSEWTDCTMTLPSSSWQSRYLAEGGWAESCFAVLHEWGHLTGHPHSNVSGEYPEPPGMTAEQLHVMESEGYEDPARCGRYP